MDKANTLRAAHPADDISLPGPASGDSCNSLVFWLRPMADKESSRLRRRPTLAALRQARRAQEPATVHHPRLRGPNWPCSGPARYHLSPACRSEDVVSASAADWGRVRSALRAFDLPSL